MCFFTRTWTRSRNSSELTPSRFPAPQHTTPTILSSSSATPLPQLPIEILELILLYFQPKCNIAKAWLTGVNGTIRSKDFQEYASALTTCSQLCLVNRAFYTIATPILYSFLLIPADPHHLQQKRCIATQSHPEFIKAIMFNGIFDAYTLDERKSEIYSTLLSTLERCTELRRIEVDLWHYPGWAVERGMVEGLFDVLKGRKLREVVLWHPGVEFFGALVEGLTRNLGREAVGEGGGAESIRGLKELTIYGLLADIIQHPPANSATALFEGLEKLKIVLLPFNGPPESFVDFMTSILDPQSRRRPSDLQLGPVPRRRPSQLRELSLDCGRRFFSTPILLRRILSTNDLHISITTLRLRLRPPGGTHYQAELDSLLKPDSSSHLTTSNPLADSHLNLTTFDTLPTSLLQLCPNVTTFHWLTWCPISFLFGNLPERIVELGVRIADDPRTWASTDDSPSINANPHPNPPSTTNEKPRTTNGLPPPYPPSTLHDVDPLIRFVSEPGYRKGVKRLYVEWAIGKRDEEEEQGLRGVCGRVGVELLEGVDF
ncbi:hypothetical protein BDN72DRAFT_899496 [Pluteus cervinus]|uniref:Uncharacterized protein n=1 Tax=Pluteus cervinus TaxID=181527 RepID=A0ACD3ALL0_9AGAR|nr:hypothetical protein BDN72DRAFT_899496 [Pluteus cervinus]